MTTMHLQASSVVVVQGRQSHPSWQGQGQGGGSASFGNSAYSPYNYPQQGGNK